MGTFRSRWARNSSLPASLIAETWPNLLFNQDNSIGCIEYWFLADLKTFFFLWEENRKNKIPWEKKFLLTSISSLLRRFLIQVINHSKFIRFSLSLSLSFLPHSLSLSLSLSLVVFYATTERAGLKTCDTKNIRSTFSNKYKTSEDKN